MVMTTAPLDRRNAPATASWARAALVGILTVAAAVHLQLTGEHFESSAVMGAGFIGAAVAELGLALAVLVRPRRLVYLAVVAVAAALIGMYGFNVMVGLPLQSGHLQETAAHRHAGADGTVAPAAGHAGGGHGAGGPHSEGGLVVGSGEPIDALGGATKLGEMVAIGLALMLLSRRSGPG